MTKYTNYYYRRGRAGQWRWYINWPAIFQNDCESYAVFFLFANIKQKLRGIDFSTAKKTVNAFEERLAPVSTGQLVLPNGLKGFQRS